MFYVVYYRFRYVISRDAATQCAQLSHTSRTMRRLSTGFFSPRPLPTNVHPVLAPSEEMDELNRNELGVNSLQASEFFDQLSSVEQ